MKIKNIGEVVTQLKTLLPQYLKDKGLEFRDPLFQCPNYKEHENADDKPSCGFLPDSNQEKFHCFACGVVGDIFHAVSLLEGKNITGLGFYKTVQSLAEKYDVKYELEEPTEEEKQFDITQSFLNQIVNSAHKYLIEKKPKEIFDYIKKRGWKKSISKFELGYLPRNEKTKAFFIKAYKEHPEIKNLISLSDEQIVDRLIYPIKSRHGIILGITHRATNPRDYREKYIKHFVKSINKKGVLLNLTTVHPKIYIVEGGSSVLTLHQNGVENAVAILGTGFNEAKYKSLIRNRIKEIVLCFDGDKAGDECLERAIKVVQNKADIKVYVKKLTGNKDPDDILNEGGIKAFKKIPEMSLFKYQILRLKEKDDVQLRESIYELILATNDSIIRERMVKLFTKEIKTQKTSLLTELKKYEQLHSLSTDVSVADVLTEKEGLKKELEKFEERAWRTDKLLGASTGFSILDDKFDGLQDGLHEIGGIWNVGKSAYLLSMALNMLKNPDNHVLYFTLDDPIQTKTLPRAMANLSKIPINVAANPLWKIQKNETLQEIEKIELAEKRETAYKLLEEMSSRFSLKDSSHGYYLDFVEKMIKIRKLIAGDKKLIVFIDFLHMVSAGKQYVDSTEALTKISQQLKHFSGIYNVPIITTVEGTKEIGSTQMKGKHIKGSVSLQYGADTIMLLSSDFYENPRSNMYFRDESGNAKPIVKVRVDKNKISGFKGDIYFKFYPELSRFEECEYEDQIKYRKLG